MDRPFRNAYDDDTRAHAYAGLEFPGTYYLAFRDIPDLLQRHVRGRAAVDFGCGAGRSSRFLKEQGYDVIGVDISASMLEHARAHDPGGTYLRVPDGDLSRLGTGTRDLVFSAFTFDNVPGRDARAHLFREFHRILAPSGTVVNLVSAPDIYLNEWVSFSTRDFPANRSAGSGDPVRIVMLDGPDRRPIDDVLWLDRDYRELYEEAGLELLELHRPLGAGSDPVEWITETRISPWAIYVLGASGGSTAPGLDDPDEGPPVPEEA